MPLKYGRLRKGIHAAITSLTQSTLDGALKRLEEREKQKILERQEYENVKKQLFPKLLELHEAGFSLREISQELGISHSTLARYLKIAKGEKSLNEKEA